jgi:GH18 family chitinase
MPWMQKTVRALGLSFLAAMPSAAAPKKPVLAFYTQWNAPGSVDFSKITHLLFAFSLPNGGGSVNGYVPGGVVSQAHAAGVKCMISIGGVNNSAAFPGIAANAGSRTAFANSVKSILDQNNVDGVDIDWEFPANAQDSANFTLLLKAVRAAVGTKLISCDVAPDGEKGQWVSRSAATIPDFWNIMAYDYTGAFPGSLIGQHAPYSKATVAMTYWRAKGAPKDHIIMGLPFYGKDFNAGGNAVPYSQIIGANPGLSPDADSVGRTWFNGVTTIKKKATYVAQNSYGGIMVWEMNMDASGSKSLMNAALEGLQAEPVSLAYGRGALAGGAQAKARIALTGGSVLSALLPGRDALGHRLGSARGAGITFLPSAPGSAPQGR